MAAFKCTSDVKVLIPQLVKAYVAALSSKTSEVPDDVKAILPQGTVLEQALFLARKAFESTPTFFFHEHVKHVPKHCFRRDILSVDAFTAVVESKDVDAINAYLTKTLGSFDNAKFCM